MDKEKDKNKLIIILAVLAIIIPIVSYLIGSSKKTVDDIKIVTDYNDFYTVNSCLNRFNSYLNDGAVDSVIVSLSSDYKKNNNITKENVLSNITETLENSNIVSKKMYYQNITESLKKFYTSSELVVEDFDGIKQRKTVYYIVYIDSKNKTFAIEPYNGEVFLGGEYNE